MEERSASSHETQTQTTAFHSGEEEQTDVSYEDAISTRDVEDSSRKQAASCTTRAMLIILAVAVLLNTAMCLWFAISFQRAGLSSSEPPSATTTMKSNMTSGVAREQLQLDALQNTITKLAESFSKSQMEHDSTLELLSQAISSNAAAVIRLVNSTAESMVRAWKKNENVLHRTLQSFDRNADSIVNSIMNQNEVLQNLSLAVTGNAEENNFKLQKLLIASTRSAEKFDYVFRNLSMSIKRNVESTAYGSMKIEDTLRNLSFIVYQNFEDMIHLSMKQNSAIQNLTQAFARVTEAEARQVARQEQALQNISVAVSENAKARSYLGLKHENSFQTLAIALTRNSHAIDNLQLNQDEAFRNLSLVASEIVDIVSRSATQNSKVDANSALKQDNSITNLTHRINESSQVIANSEMMDEEALQNLVHMANGSEEATAHDRIKHQEALENASLSINGSLSSGNDVIRLVNGFNKYSGRVEIYYNETWGTISDFSWDINDATVVCHMLGFPDAIAAPHRALYGEGTGRIWLNNVHCTATETSLFSCSKDAWGESYYGHYRDASVVCAPPSVRLVDGTNSHSGRVEVQHNGTWGTICDDDWDINDANVICRMFGFANATSPSLDARFGQGTGKIWFSNVNCTGTERSIWNCAKYMPPSNEECGQDKDASVVCQPIAIRLVDGINSYSGRVEVNYLGELGTVSDNQWDINDAKVVCRMLGFQDAVAAHHRALYGEGTGPVWLSDVRCTGTETSLFSCSKDAWDESYYDHGRDASVVCTPPTVRLINGTNSYSGRVEVKYNGTWGTICDDDWDINDASVICRMFGFVNATSAPRGALFGQGTGKIWFNNVSCTGSEQSISNCMKNMPTSNKECGHDKDASVVCQPIAIRLVDGINSNSGRVEVNYLGEWGTVNDYQWDINDAKVVCRMLGFPDAIAAPHRAFFGKGAGRIWLSYVQCTGTETSIFTCSTNAWGYHYNGHYRDASVVCTPPTVRLINGTNSYSGRVEVHYDGTWGTICDENWDINDANVICRMFGFVNAISAPRDARFGQGTGTIWINNVGCTGTEESIWNCTKNTSNEECGHDKDASVVCQPIAVRLVDGINSYSGRVEVKYLGEWGTVCDNNWDINDANVVCRMLGFLNATSAPGDAEFGQGTGKIWLDEVGCTGAEKSIWDCPKDFWGEHDCRHFKDASVICTP